MVIIMKETIGDLISRRSIRKYKKQQISEEELNIILEAGKYSPSGMGKQPVVMVVVQDEDTREQLRRMNGSIMGNTNMDPFYGAPTIIVVLVNSKISTTYIQDGSLVMGNLMNGAYAIGVGSCWIDRAREEFESKEGRELLKKWGLSEDYVGVGHCILGYADETPEPKPRKEDYVIRV